MRPAAARPALLAVLLLFALGSLGALPVAAGSKTREASPGKRHANPPTRSRKPPPTYWGAWIGTHLTGIQPPWDMAAVQQFASLAGKGLSLVEFASPFADCGEWPCQYYRFPTSEMEAIRGYGAIPVLSWNSSGSPAETDDPNFQFADVLQGAHDAYIREFAEAARDWGHPFFLRFNWEMNGDWFAWSEAVNGNQPGEFVATWQRVHDIFTSVGAANVSWVWCPYADPHRKFGALQRFYPGDGYVDWTCMDGYNWGRNPTNPHPWRTFDLIFGKTYRSIVQRIAPEKPMMLAEIASIGSEKARSAWIKKMFWMLANRYRQVRGLIWFNQIDRGIDWILDDAPKAARTFAKGVRNPMFLGNTQGGLTGKIQAP